MNPHSHAKRKFILWALIAAAVGLGFGMIIGRFAFTSDDGDQSAPGIPDAIVQDADPGISSEIIRQISSDNIRQYLRSVHHHLLLIYRSKQLYLILPRIN
jgi:hypothetical protein